VTIRMANGAGTGFAAQHSQPAENWFLNIPGLKIAVPATPADAYGLLRAAIEDPDPVLVFEHKGLFNIKGELGDAPAPIELGRAEVVRAGEHVTVVATQQMRHRAVQAADLLQGEDVAPEIIDPRCLVPFDLDTVLKSLERTNRLVVVQEGSLPGSWGASLVASVLQTHFEMLDAPPRLVGSPETPVPYAGALEAAWVPSVEGIAQAVRETIAY
jgi:pyruvate/2-oxoglutarate/acetoin dehydrogenase E1 component